VGGAAVGGFMARFIDASRRLMLFPMLARYFHARLASAWTRRNGGIERASRANFCVHLSCFKKRVV
jgi:hypothetical protein